MAGHTLIGVEMIPQEMKKRYFVDIAATDIGGGVSTQRPNGEWAWVTALVEGMTTPWIDRESGADPRIVVVENVEHGVIVGRRILFNDIVAFAIEHGFLEELGEAFSTGP